MPADLTCLRIIMAFADNSKQKVAAREIGEAIDEIEASRKDVHGVWLLLDETDPGLIRAYSSEEKAEKMRVIYRIPETVASGLSYLTIDKDYTA